MQFIARGRVMPRPTLESTYKYTLPNSLFAHLTNELHRLLIHI